MKQCYLLKLPKQRFKMTPSQDLGIRMLTPCVCGGVLFSLAHYVSFILGLCVPESAEVTVFILLHLWLLFKTLKFTSYLVFFKTFQRIW